MEELQDNASHDARLKALEWGREGERITREFIASQGFPITAFNWKCGNKLELDIVSQQGDEMVFVEVKTRNGKFDSAEDAIDEKKIKQIVKAANAFLGTLERPFDARFDVALIEGTPDNYEFTYLKNAFVPPLCNR